MSSAFASPRADAAFAPEAVGGVVATVLDGLSLWTVLMTIFVGAVIYDQCKRLPLKESRYLAH